MASTGLFQNLDVEKARPGIVRQSVGPNKWYFRRLESVLLELGCRSGLEIRTGVSIGASQVVVEGEGLA